MDAVAEVKSRLSIEDVIADYVRLKRTGKNYKGLSPFSNEKTPSFVVSPEKQIWHDFSSGRGGDIFTFVGEVEGLDFKATLELLARRAGVDLDQYRSKSGSGEGPNKERLYQLLDEAAKFYQVQLTANKLALDYITKKREFKRQTIVDFRLGYSPSTGQALLHYLQKKGFSDDEIRLTGLAVNRSGGGSQRMTDMFRGRIMIPLSDQFGKVIGFTARLLEDNKEAPKYINTPSTPLYDKSRHIYGLHLAKQAIQKEKFSTLVEGNLDVISSHQAGIANVVATAGTALTEMQLKILGRFSPDVRLAFDEDQAGLNATERAIPLASQAGIELSIITIPTGKDPDELVRQDKAVWQKVINEHQYALDWLIKTYEERLDLSSGAGKRQFTTTVLAIVKNLKDPVEKDHYVGVIAKKIDIDPDSIRAKLKTSQTAPSPRLRPVKAESKSNDIDNVEAIKTGDRLLSLALMLPGTRGYLEGMIEQMFATDQARKLYSFLHTNSDFDSSALDKSPDLHDIQSYVKIVTLQFEELYAQVDTLELQYEAARLRTKLVELFVRHQKKQISKKLEVANPEEANKLLIKVRKLDQLLKNTKE